MRSVSTFKVNLEVDWQHQKICLQDLNMGGLRWTLDLPDSITIQGAIMAISITDIQKFTASIQPVDAKGNPATVDGVPTWTVGDPTLLTVTTATDGLSAEVLAVGPLGVTQLTVEADADLGSGVVPLTGVLDVTILGSQATTLNIVTSVPTNQ